MFILTPRPSPGRLTAATSELALLGTWTTKKQGGRTAETDRGGSMVRGVRGLMFPRERGRWSSADDLHKDNAKARSTDMKRNDNVKVTYWDNEEYSTLWYRLGSILSIMMAIATDKALYCLAVHHCSTKHQVLDVSPRDGFHNDAKRPSAQACCRFVPKQPSYPSGD
jgi:hypothetical protein